MSVLLPEPVPGARQWQLVDYVTRTGRAQESGGVILVELPALDMGERWLVDHVVVSTTSTTKTVLRLYDGPVAAERLLSGTPSGNLDEADYAGGLLVDSGAMLVAQWTGASAGSTGLLRVQARRLMRL